MLAALDHAWMREVYAGSTTGLLGWVMLAATWLGSGWSMLGLLPMLGIRRSRPFALALLATLLTSAALVFVLKALVRRPRPFVGLAGIVPLAGAPTDFSFPSGHAAGSATFAFFVAATGLAALRHGELAPALRGPVAAGVALALALAAAVALSRVYLGVHYPADVLAGSALGALIGLGGATWYRRSRTPASAD